MKKEMSEKELEEFIAEGEYQERTKYDDAMIELSLRGLLYEEEER